MYNVLVVEDDPIVRTTVGRMLKPEGYEVGFAVNCGAGFEAALRDKPDLILLDVHLPDGNGIELCRKLKADQRLRHIPIIIVTGEAIAVESRAEGLDSGADDYVLKPFNDQELTLRMKRILEQGPRRA